VERHHRHGPARCAALGVAQARHGGHGSDAKPIPERVDAWAKRNDCTAAGNDQWTCPVGAEVVLYTIEGGGHTWPGSAFDANLADLMGPTSTDIDATALMWQFFATHPLAG